MPRLTQSPNVVRNMTTQHSTMFKDFFGNNQSVSKTGFFKVDKDKLIAINEIPGNGSINSCIECLGFATNQIRTINTFSSDKTDCLCKPPFFPTENKAT